MANVDGKEMFVGVFVRTLIYYLFVDMTQYYTYIHTYNTIPIHVTQKTGSLLLRRSNTRRTLSEATPWSARISRAEAQRIKKSQVRREEEKLASVEICV